MTGNGTEADELFIVNVGRLYTALPVPLNNVGKVMFWCVCVIQLQLFIALVRISVQPSNQPLTRLNHTRRAVSRSAAVAQRDP